MMVESNSLFSAFRVEDVLLILIASVTRSHHETKWMFHDLSKSPFVSSKEILSYISVRSHEVQLSSVIPLWNNNVKKIKSIVLFPGKLIH